MHFRTRTNVQWFGREKIVFKMWSKHHPKTDLAVFVFFILLMSFVQNAKFLKRIFIMSSRCHSDPAPEIIITPGSLS